MIVPSFFLCNQYRISTVSSKYSVDRVQKLKDAKAEAQKEIEMLKAQKEKEFLQFVQKVCVYTDIVHISL